MPQVLVSMSDRTGSAKALQQRRRPDRTVVKASWTAEYACPSRQAHKNDYLDAVTES